VHRDLKPENVLLTPDGEGVRLTDFGIAKLEDSKLTRTGTSLGTPSYVAPEQIRDSKRAQPSADIYGLGGILYTILTRRPPYYEASASETIVAVLKGELIPPRDIVPEIPEAIAAVCVRALSLDPADRPQTAKAFAAELERALASS
jgi:serine/threonine-protein kinase